MVFMQWACNCATPQPVAEQAVPVPHHTPDIAGDPSSTPLRIENATYHTAGIALYANQLAEDACVKWHNCKLLE